MAISSILFEIANILKPFMEKSFFGVLKKLNFVLIIDLLQFYKA
jgi:hypothetical protein